MGNPFPQGFAGSNPARSTNSSNSKNKLVLALFLYSEILIEANTAKA